MTQRDIIVTAIRFAIEQQLAPEGRQAAQSLVDYWCEQDKQLRTAVSAIVEASRTAQTDWTAAREALLNPKIQLVRDEE